MIANHFLSNVFLESVFWAEHLTIKYIPVKRKFSARALTLLLLVAGQGSLFCSFAAACHYVSVEQTLTVFSFNIQPFTHLHNSFTIYNSAHMYTTHLQVSIFILKSYISCSVCFKLCWNWNQACFSYYMQHQQQNTRSSLFPMSIFIEPKWYQSRVDLEVHDIRRGCMTLVKAVWL